MPKKSRLDRIEDPKEHGGLANVVTWENRICGHADVAPQTLHAHPQNWRAHPQHQRHLMREVLTEVGFVQSVIVNQRTGVIVDGHLRVALAIHDAQKTVPVTYVDLSHEEENVILRTFDPLSALAETDQTNLARLTELLPSGLPPDLSQWIDAMNEQAGLTAEIIAAATEPIELVTPEEEPGLDEIVAFREDVVFSSSNEYGIPDMLPDMMADTWPEFTYDRGPCETPPEQTMFLYGRQLPDNIEAGGFLGFFVEDIHFEKVYADAVNYVQWLRAYPWTAILAPDFSLWSHTPAVIALYNIFRRQWCARYWQEAGFKVMPILSSPAGFGEKGIDWALLGFPEVLPVVALQCRTGKRSPKDQEAWGRSMAICMEKIAPQRVVIYGGMEASTWIHAKLPTGPEYTLLPAWSELMMRRRQVAHMKRDARAANKGDTNGRIQEQED